MPYFRSKRLAPKSGEICRDLLGHGFWRAEVERSQWPDLIHEGLLRRNGESAGLADFADHLQVARPELARALSSVSATCPGECTPTGRGARPSPRGPDRRAGERTCRGSNDNRKHKRESIPCGAHDRLGVGNRCSAQLEWKGTASDPDDEATQPSMIRGCREEA
jgi:hypothetical protein